MMGPRQGAQPSLLYELSLYAIYVSRGEAIPRPTQQMIDFSFRSGSSGR